MIFRPRNNQSPFMLCDTNIFPGLKDNVKRQFHYIFKRGDGTCTRQFTGLFRGNQFFKHKIEEEGVGGWVGPDLFDPPPGSYRISFFSLCTEVQSNGDHASCQRNQLMQQAWLSKNERDYIAKSTRKLCRVILFAGIKEISINTFNNSNIGKKEINETVNIIHF